MLFWVFLLAGSSFMPENVEALAHPVHHQLRITLDPEKSTARIRDKLSIFPGNTPSSTLRFLLHNNYQLETILSLSRGNWTIDTETIKQSGIRLTRLILQNPPGEPWPETIKLKIQYSGSFEDLKQSDPAEKMTDEKIKPGEGILLGAESYFYPVFEEASPRTLVTFEMTADTPEKWKTVSQGKRVLEEIKDGRRVTTWESEQPQQGIFLIADQFEEYQKKKGDLTLYAFLREPDRSLAEKYIEAASYYIDFYEKLLGPYPYPKFALVENSRQTGYGMPSFTLLGSRVIRLPFILNTSYPHEILHNWFGNGIYPDPSDGNWSEGLTAYLSDHLFLESRGKGDGYRFQEMMKYLNYVNEKNDFPLQKFKWRNSMASQAIGYGKMLMVFHMLRMEMGDAIFLEGLRELYKNRKFRFAGFDILKAVFKRLSQKDLSAFFDQWLLRPGSPEITLKSANSVKVENGFELRLDIRQIQKSEVFKLKLPIAVWMKGSDTPVIKKVTMQEKQQSFSLSVPEEPAAVMIDPYYDVFRKLDREEAPPSIGQTYGDPDALVVLPSREPDAELRKRYETSAHSLTPKGNIIPDTNFSLEKKTTVWVFGRTNLTAGKWTFLLQKYGAQFDEKGVTVEGKSLPWKNHSFVFTLPHPSAKGKSVTWVIADRPDSLPGLMRKLPHYGKYGYLAFEGTAPDNRLKVTWPAKRARMMKKFVEGNYALPAQTPLVAPSTGYPRS